MQSQTDGQVVGAVTEAVTEAVTGAVTEQQGAVEGLAVVAVYYSGQWLHQFQPNLTFDKGLFYPPSGNRSVREQVLVFIASVIFCFVICWKIPPRINETLIGEATVSKSF